MVAASTRWADALSRVPPLPPVGAAFLAAGRRTVRRAMVRKWGIIGGVAVLAVSALTAGGLALQNHVDTDQQHAIALSRQFAAASLAMDAGDPTTARQLAVAAFYVSPTDQARSAMAAMLAEQQQSGTMFTGASANGVAFSRTASCWPPPTPTGTSGCGTRPPASPPASRSRSRPTASSTPSKGWRSARTARCWPPPTATGTSSCGTPPPASRSASRSQPGQPAGPSWRAWPRWRSAERQAAGHRRQRRVRPAVEPRHRPVRQQDPGRGGRGVFPPPGGRGAFSPDGKPLATADYNGYVRLWNTATGQPAGQPIRADRALATQQTAWRSARRKPLASGDADGYVRLWNAATGKLFGKPLLAASAAGASGQAAFAVAFSPDGKLLASGDTTGTSGCGTPPPVSPPARRS